MSAIDLSLVIPTFNERANISPLVNELEMALAGIDWEVIFVDDSNDGTEKVIEKMAETDPRLGVHHRPENYGGLAGAVVEGLALARGTYICVLDADLQHPPEKVPELLAAAQVTSADVVIASRYVPGGSNGGLDGPMRQFYSRGLKRLSQLVFPRRLAGITDPLGGYFLVRRAVVQNVPLFPIGYKILLEILVRCPWKSSAEVPYSFQPRRFGSSKADLRQGIRFLHHLSILFRDCSPLCAVPRVFVGQRAARGAATTLAR